MKFISKFYTGKFRTLVESCSINLWFIAIYLIVSSLTRLILVYDNFAELGDSIYLFPISLAVGVIFDFFIALCITLPLVLVLLVLPSRCKLLFIFRWVTSIAGFVFIFGILYLGVAEIIFFDEFSSRFNYVAVDYLIYPHEVFINIWDTYPVLSILIVTGLSSLFFAWLAGKKLYRSLLTYPKSFRNRFGILLSHCLLIMLMLFSLGADFAKISDNRILNEISLNGIYTFIYAGITNELDYNQYYKTMDNSMAFKQLRQLLTDCHVSFFNDDNIESIDRFVTSDRELHRYNIVMVLEESFGSDFVGTLHPKGLCLTPRFDSLIHQGMLFSHIYATGNRTVRGLEASLASFPPIPGRSIVKRPGCEQVFTLPSVLKGLDYNTVFLYGGLSYFDNLEHFASTNGFDQIIDETDFKDPIFSTIWGVCDEDLFAHSLTVFDSLSKQDKPFFATLITVSNHTPYTYPKGRIPYDPEDRTRSNAVRYADYAIGKFIEDAQAYAFFDSTLFVILADHGARVYGSEQIPMRSYEIPVLFYNPQLIPAGEMIDFIGSQMDLAPTILDFLGVDYNSMFFGQSLLSSSNTSRRVLMSHNRDVSLLKDDTLVVLGIQGGQELWYKDSSGNFHPVIDTGTLPLVEETIAYYMTAYNMFINHQLHPLEQNFIIR